MNDKYELILGLEVHMQLNTSQKMFCSCKAEPFFDEPNTNVCPVCLGLPGAMPVPNQEAIKLSQKMAYALGGNLNSQIVFERKNYSYPDLPKGFQLTCPHYPISTGGELNLNYFGISYPIRWREIHLEEDTAKSIHDKKTFIDFNKSGVPLLEMVTEPDFRSIDDAVIFCKEIQLVARNAKASNADMEKGQMRLEANISVRKIGDKELPNYRVELKNINSFNFMRKALEYELRRQMEAIENGEILHQETRGFNENTQTTFVQRSKEEANDYRYFPEPDILPLVFTDEHLKQITTLDFELPMVTRDRLLKLNIPHNYIDLLISDMNLLNKVDILITKYNLDPKKACTLCIDYPDNKNISADLIFTNIQSHKSEIISNDKDLSNIIDQVIESNYKAVDDFRNGKETVLQFLLGQIMKISNGKADIKIAKDILLTKLNTKV